MQASRYPWNLGQSFNASPNLGSLVDLCEENYCYLMRMAPDLQMLRGRYRSSLVGGVDLHLEIMEQTSYTTLVHLTYYFEDVKGHFSDPDTLLRVYHDARQVEVLELRQSALPFSQDDGYPTLEQKWKICLFLSKWLSYCVRQGHSFTENQVLTLPDNTDQLLASC